MRIVLKNKTHTYLDVDLWVIIVHLILCYPGIKTPPRDIKLFVDGVEIERPDTFDMED